MLVFEVCVMSDMEVYYYLHVIDMHYIIIRFIVQFDYSCIYVI